MDVLWRPQLIGIKRWPHNTRKLSTRHGSEAVDARRPARPVKRSRLALAHPGLGENPVAEGGNLRPLGARLRTDQPIGVIRRQALVEGADEATCLEVVA